MIKVDTAYELVGPRQDKSWFYHITLGRISPVSVTSFGRYSSERGARKAGERFVARFKKEAD